MVGVSGAAFFGVTSQPVEGADECFRSQSVAAEAGVDLQVGSGCDAGTAGRLGESVEGVDRRNAQLDIGAHRLVEVSGGSVEPGEDLRFGAQQAAQVKGFGDRGDAELAPPGREEGGCDEVDAVAVGVGFDDAFEASR